MAQLIIDQKPYGMHLFLCQLRDLHDHKPLPGNLEIHSPLVAVLLIAEAKILINVNLMLYHAD